VTALNAAYSFSSWKTDSTSAKNVVLRVRFEDLGLAEARRSKIAALANNPNTPDSNLVRAGVPQLQRILLFDGLVT
jgi:hypothetical protein